jgi:hypothetical protein
MVLCSVNLTDWNCNGKKLNEYIKIKDTEIEFGRKEYALSGMSLS